MGKYTCTKELRRMLDERGAAWVAIAETATEYTHEGILYRAYEICDGLQVAIVTPVTPEQAIAATVGAGTCDGSFHESNDLSSGRVPLYYCKDTNRSIFVEREAKVCPLCGGRIKEEAE